MKLGSFTISTVAAVCILGYSMLFAQETSSGTVTLPGAPAANDGMKGINSAISDVNYKLELLRTRYIELNQEIEELKAADREMERELSGQKRSRPDPRKIDIMESELKLVRSEIAQAREDIALLKSESRRSAQEPRERESVLHSPWLAVSSIGLSLLAILIAL